MKIKEYNHYDNGVEIIFVHPDHSVESTPIVTEITDGEEEIAERVEDGGCNLHSSENLLAGPSPCRWSNNSICSQGLHLNSILGAWPVHNRVFESLCGNIKFRIVLILHLLYIPAGLRSR